VSQSSVDSINLSDIEFWALPWAEREAAFAVLRRERPIAFFEELELPFLPKGPGYFAITRHADILDISRQPEIFCSSKGATSIPDMPTEMLDFYGSMINMDDPRHQRLRGIVSRRFTPKMIQAFMDDVEKITVDVIERVVDKGSADFVSEIAAPMPLIVICNLMGIPESQHQLIFEKSNVILSGGDPEFLPPDTENPIGVFLEAGASLAAVLRDIAQHRVKHPSDDLTSALVNTELDGERLTDEEIASFFILLAVAGNETTRTAISHGMVALEQHPDQARVWRNDFENVAPTAVEEIVRWATPVIFMRRTATRDYELSGHRFHEGDKTILFYNSGNRDEAAFEDPYKFDLRRAPNPHVGYGGPGPHFCLGAHLARREITVMFRELFKRIPDIHISGAPAQLRSPFINGIKRLPVEFTPGGARAA